MIHERSYITAKFKATDIHQKVILDYFSWQTHFLQSSCMCREFRRSTTVSKESYSIFYSQQVSPFCRPREKNHSAMKKHVIGSLDKQRHCQVESCAKKCGKGGSIVSYECNFYNRPLLGLFQCPYQFIRQADLVEIEHLTSFLIMAFLHEAYGLHSINSTNEGK